MISFEITQISRGFFLEDLKDWHTGESPSVVVTSDAHSSFIWTFQDQALEGTQDEK